MGKKKTKPVNTHPNRIGIKEAMGYMMGDAGNLFVLTYVSSFLKVFYTDVLLISPGNVATLFLVTRLWDAINDPLWGGIVAKRPPTKDGRRLGCRGPPRPSGCCADTSPPARPPAHRGRTGPEPTRRPSPAGRFPHTDDPLAPSR